MTLTFIFRFSFWLLKSSVTIKSCLFIGKDHIYQKFINQSINASFIVLLPIKASFFFFFWSETKKSILIEEKKPEKEEIQEKEKKPRERWEVLPTKQKLNKRENTQLKTTKNTEKP